MDKSKKELFLEKCLTSNYIWNVCSKSDVYDYTDKHDCIINCYFTNYQNSKGNTNTIYLIERNEYVFDENFAEYRDMKTYEIIVISDSKIIANLSQYNVPRETFFELVRKIINSQMENNDDLL